MPENATPLPPPGSAADRGSRQRAVLVRARALAAENDWDGLLDLGVGTNNHFMLPDSFSLFLGAALARGAADPLRHIVQQGTLCDMPPRFRAAMARRTAINGWPDLAMHLLAADPATFSDPEAAVETSFALFRIAHEARLRAQQDRGWDLLATASAVAYRRFIRKAPDTRHPAPFGFAPSRPCATLLEPRYPLRILAAPGVREHAAARWQEQEAAFEADLATATAPDVFAWHDVYANRLGQIWNSAGEALFSRHGPIPPASLAAMPAAPVLEAAVLAVGVEDRNFFHWYAEWLPGLAWRLTPDGPCLPLLVRDDAPTFMLDSLRLAGEATAPQRVGDAVFVRRLHHLGRGLDVLVHDALFAPLFQRITAKAMRQGQPGPGPWLYLSRRDSDRRRMTNEAALEAALLDEGVAILVPGQMSLADQIRAIEDAEVIISPHGAALAHLVASQRPGRQVVELMPVLPGDAERYSCFVRLSRLRHLRHVLWLEEADPSTEAWSVDLPAFLGVIRPMLREAATR